MTDSAPTVVVDGETATVAPAFTVGVPASADERDLAATLESVWQSAARMDRPFEIVVAVNGPDEPSPAVVGVEAFAAVAARAPVVRVLRLTVRSKVAAWNAIRDAARAPVLVFTDADVRLAPDAIPRLLARLDAEPGAAAVGGQEVPVVTADDGLAAKVAALPFRFRFGNLPGPLYALRRAAAEPIPAHVLAEDSYLTVRVGRARIVRERGALVYFRPPATWRDYLRSRVRNEASKLQLTRDFPRLLAAGGLSPYPWGEFLRGIRPREYALVVCLVVARLVARLRARHEFRTGFRAGWTALRSTKEWPAGAAAVTGAERRPGGAADERALPAPSVRPERGIP